MKHHLTALLGAIAGIVLSGASQIATAHILENITEPATASTRSATTMPAPSGLSAGCGRTGHHSTGQFTWNVKDGNGTTRSFLVDVPGDYNPEKPYSLTFVFHGAGGSSSQSYSWGLQNASGASENGIFIFPNGINYENYGIGWDDSSNGYDIPFFKNMVSDVETYFCVNTAQLFVAGFSWGGDFATALVCNVGNAIRAAAVNSTDDEFTQSTNYLTYADLPCPTSVHPAVRFEHAVGGDSAYPAPDFANTSKLYQYFSSCSASSTAVASSTTTMSCVSYNSCSSQFIECSFNTSIGHALPPNWASDTWAFFSTFK